ncbi:MAG: FadR/GntR family transcriptional regulator [Chitinophagaceae bacterium]
MENNISRKSLAEEVAARIQQQIVSGHYKVGEKLPVEPELMRQFGVGRSSVREAIKLLVNSGLLRVQQGLGTFVEDNSGIKEPLVQRLKRSDVKDMDEVRQLLEMKIAEKAALNRTEEDIVTITHFLEERKKAAFADDIKGCIEADISFHIAIADASGNEILSDLYKTFTATIKNTFLSLYSDAAIFRETDEQHRQLLNSIIDKKAREAWHFAALINGHITA